MIGVHRLHIKDGPPREPPATDRPLIEINRNRSLVCGYLEPLSLTQENNGVVRLTKTKRNLNDPVDNWSNLRWRAANNVQDVTGRSLVFEGFLKLARPRLDL